MDEVTTWFWVEVLCLVLAGRGKEETNSNFDWDLTGWLSFGVLVVLFVLAKVWRPLIPISYRKQNKLHKQNTTSYSIGFAHCAGRWGKLLTIQFLLCFFLGFVSTVVDKPVILDGISTVQSRISWWFYCKIYSFIFLPFYLAKIPSSMWFCSKRWSAFFSILIISSVPSNLNLNASPLTPTSPYFLLNCPSWFMSSSTFNFCFSCLLKKKSSITITNSSFLTGCFSFNWSIIKFLVRLIQLCNPVLLRFNTKPSTVQGDRKRTTWNLQVDVSIFMDSLVLYPAFLSFNTEILLLRSDV